MEITIQSIHFNSKTALNDFITEKVNKLAHLLYKIESALVTLKMEKTYTGEIKICDIRLAVPGNDLYVTRQNETFEAATHEAVDALLEQIKRMKGKAMAMH